MNEDLKANQIIRRPKRIVLDLGDVMLVIHRGKTTAWRTMKKIRELYKKPLKGKVTIRDLSKFTGVAVDEINEIIISRDEPEKKSLIKM